jgi:hypothetical protein
VMREKLIAVIHALRRLRERATQPPLHQCV